MEATILATPRLALIAATAETLHLASEDRRDRLGRSLQAGVAADWPPALNGT